MRTDGGRKGHSESENAEREQQSLGFKQKVQEKSWHLSWLFDRGFGHESRGGAGPA